MPAWLLRLVWRVRGKRRVRLHLVDRVESFEGVQIGKWGGCFLLASASMLMNETDTVSLDGIIEIATSRVLFAQVLS